MNSYKVAHTTQGTATIQASRYVQDGAGTRFYGEDGELIASFYDGEIKSVTNASVVFIPVTEDPEIPEA